ncbi:hypothetical protein A2U01_0106590, partial [Trifolium medium]|nr:hypothetical protein [Trifolium medium]
IPSIDNCSPRRVESEKNGYRTMDAS